MGGRDGYTLFPYFSARQARRKCRDAKGDFRPPNESISARVLGISLEPKDIATRTETYITKVLN